MPSAILHIGTEKTGTSAIQAYLAAHRQRLRAEGFFYSSIPGGQNHTSLAAYAEDDAKLDDLRMAAGLNSPAKLAEFRERLEHMIGDEVAAAPNATFLFSSEHCHSRLITEAEVARLHGLLARHFTDIRIIVYLRRQDEVAVSHYSTLLKAGGTRAAILDSRTLDRNFLDYHAMLERWAAIFGRDALTVARFDRAEFPGGSIIPDFCARTGVRFVDDGPRSANESLRPPHQEFLRRINERLPRFVGGALNPLRGGIEHFVEAIGSGSGRQPAAENARALYEAYRASNEAIRADFFPDRPALFDEDFSRYPEDGDPADLAIGEALDIMAAIWAAGVQERNALRIQVTTQPLAPATVQPPPPAPALRGARARLAANTPRRQLGAVANFPAVNNGYQRDDQDIVDYQLWQIEDQKLRGPEPDRTQPYFAAIGAAQVFGRFTTKPFPALLAEQIGLPALNLGMSGAGPSFFLQREALIEAANRARFVIVQLMSGRSVSNRVAALGVNQGVMRLRDDPAAPPHYAEDVYKDLLGRLTPAEMIELRAENRNTYVEEMRALLDRIERPKILLYWSRRPVAYEEGLDRLESYWGDFPHFVNREVIDAIRPFADHYVETVTERGLPQPLLHRETGAPVVIFPEDRFPNVRLRDHNHYYPSPQMNEDVAEALLPAARALAARADPKPSDAPFARPRDLLVHVHMYKNGGAAIDQSLSESFGAGWKRLPPATNATLPAANALQSAADEDPRLRAVTVHRTRFPFSEPEGMRFHPLVVLRDPLARARTIYDQDRALWRGEASDTMHTKMAYEHDFCGWIDWCLSAPILAAPIANYQTRMCCLSNNGSRGEDWHAPITLGNFREALDMLSSGHVAVLEEFETSLLRIERALRPYFPGLKLLPHLERASINDGILIDYSTDQARAELGEMVYEKLCAANSHDLLLVRRFSQS